MVRLLAGLYGRYAKLVRDARIGSDPPLSTSPRGERRMVEIRTRPLMSLKLLVSAMQSIGPAPGGDRRVGVVAGGTFSGERLNGTVMEGGAARVHVGPGGAP